MTVVVVPNGSPTLLTCSFSNGRRRGTSRRHSWRFPHGLRRNVTIMRRKSTTSPACALHARSRSRLVLTSIFKNENRRFVFFSCPARSRIERAPSRVEWHLSDATSTRNEPEEDAEFQYLYQNCHLPWGRTNGKSVGEGEPCMQRVNQRDFPS